MKKRALCILLSVILFICAIPGGAFTANAKSELTTSDTCIEMLKEFEGFRAYPYWDYSHYSIGYGNRCPDDMVDYYFANGMTEEEADALLRQYIAETEKTLNSFADKYSLNFTQSQFDALILFTYNVGGGWLYQEDYLVTQAVITGATGNEFIRPFVLWCSAGDEILDILIDRRLIECNMYLYGVYSMDVPENYGYVRYDANGGSVEHRVQGYDTNLTSPILETPTCEGYTFAGWFTERSGGTQVTVLDGTVKNRRLYAQWIDPSTGQIVVPEIRIPEGTPIEAVEITVTNEEINLREGPGTGYNVVGTANPGNKLTITATYEADGYLWGKFDGGWIALEFTNYDQLISDGSQQPEIELPQNATQISPVEVTAKEAVNLRLGPGLSYTTIGTVLGGQKLTVTATFEADGYLWGMTQSGWIALEFTNYAEVTGPVEIIQPEGTQALEPALDVKVTADSVNLLQGPAESYSVLETAAKDQTLTVTATLAAGEKTWGLTDKGWINLKNTNYEEVTSPQPDGTDTIDPMVVQVVRDDVNLREGPGLSYSTNGTAMKGQVLTITATAQADGYTWGKFDGGWICMDYVEPVSETASSPFEDVPSNAYYANAVAWAVDKGITAGKTDTTFQPDGDCTRAQIVTFLWRANGRPEPESWNNPFTDVSEDAYYYQAVLWAVEQGITAGKTETTFEPNTSCTRAQAVTFMWREAGRPGHSTQENPFEDVSGGTYYYDAVLWAMENGITAGKTATTFQPDATCIRAQIVTFLYRAVN